MLIGRGLNRLIIKIDGGTLAISWGFQLSHTQKQSIMAPSTFTVMECASWKIKQLPNCSPDSPAAPSSLASLQQGGGDLWQ